MINHLDWFLSTVWKMVSTVEVEPQMRTDINNMAGNAEALRVAAEDRNKQLLFQASVKPAAKGAAAPRPPSLTAEGWL